MGKDLRSFLQTVRALGPDFYVESKRPLKPNLEPFVIQQKLASEGRFPVIYCPEIEGSRLPLVTNLFGSYEMLGLALDIDPRQGADKASVLKEYKERLKKSTPVQMVPASEAPVKEIVLRGKDVDLGLLPITRHAELDSGKYEVIAPLICKDPDTGILNAGIYRKEVKGKTQLSCMIAPPHDTAHIARRHAALGKPMEVVIAVGHHPAVGIATATRYSLGINELELAGGLLGEPLKVTKAETVDVPVPAGAEIIIEGVIDPTKMTTDGPFAEYTGYYGEAMKPAYLINITAMTMRRDAIYHDLDPAHREHNMCAVLGKESVAYDAVRKIVPNLKAVHYPASGCNVFHVYVSIDKRIQGQGKLAGLAALSEDVSAKVAFVVDSDIDIYNEGEVLWAVATRVVWDRNVSIIPGVTGQDLDPSRYDELRHRREGGYMVTKVIIDATRPVELPFPIKIAPPKELWHSMRLEDYLK